MVRSALLLLALGACVVNPKSTADGGAPSSDAGPTVASAADASVRDCAQDPITKVILCTAVAQCPELAINHDVFPNCGYRPRAGGFDIACWCNGYLCPMGSPTSCAEAKQLIENQNELAVCTQVNEGRCTQPQVSGTGGGGTTGGTTGADSRCAECMKQCGYTPGCKDLCGC